MSKVENGNNGKRPSHNSQSLIIPQEQIFDTTPGYGYFMND